MSFVVRCPSTFWAERSWVFDVMLRQELGVEAAVEPHEAPTVEIEHDDRKLIVRDAFLGGDPSAWRTPATLPPDVVESFDTTRLVRHAGVPARIPVLYGDASLATSEREITLGVDVFSTAFFLLSRYEEVVRTERDEHERFPASAACASQHGFLDYPLVNVCIELLWACMQRLWPGLTRPSRAARTLISCDVDTPYERILGSWRGAARRVAYDLVRLREPRRAAADALTRLRVARRGLAAHPFYCFDYYMSSVERAGLRAAFYFICGHTGGRLDGEYSLEDPPIRDLLSRAHARGHELGLHPSYHTFRSTPALCAELEALKRTCAALGIEQSAWGGRQHYLRWEPATLARWNDAGLAYDSTLTFAARAGFRTGACFEYPAYDLDARAPLALRVRPLVAMEATLLAERYQRLSHAATHEKLAAYARTTRAFSGDFTLLWHNSTLVTREDRALFEAALRL